MTISTETDLQIVNGWKARADHRADDGHYRVYEIAAASHIPVPLVPLKLVGIRSLGQAEQNHADIFPVYRAMVERLRTWIEGAEAPPPTVLIQGSVRRANAPLFSDVSWGSDNRLVFVSRTGVDGNGLGGVRLPHVLSGAPLGVYRGTHCDNDPTETDFILNCRLSGDESIYNMVGGTFTPYSELDDDLCSRLYPTHASYTAAVERAIDLAIAQKWILAEEAGTLVAKAEENTLLSPGCVPDAS